MTDKHTPTPWHASDNTGPKMQGYSQSSCVTGTGDYRMQIVAGCFKDIGGEEVASANAAFIVRACNSHYQLVEALKKFANLDKSVSSNLWAIRAEYCEQARAALAAAEKP